MLTPNELSYQKLLVAHITALGTGSTQPIEPRYGLCSNLIHYATTVRDGISYWYPNIEAAFESYEHFSGNIDYPIEWGEDAERSYDSIDDLWGGEYGKRRREFCLHVAAYFKDRPIC